MDRTTLSRGVRARRLISTVVCLSMIASLLGAATTALASTPPATPDLSLEVNSTVDGSGDCSVGSESCTLRAAVEAANDAAPGVTTIEVPSGDYVLTNGPLVISADDTYIFGAFSPISATNATRINANGSRAFDIDADGVTLAGLAITNADAGSQSGGAVSVSRNATNFVLSQSSIYNNAARQGAGLLVAGSAYVDRSTFFGNVAGQKGGGIRVGGQGTLTLVNSTFTQNAAQSGGAVSVAGLASISFSTFVDNSSSNENGAGVDRNGGTVTVTSSILTQSNQQASSGSDCSGNPDLIGVNFVGNAQGCNPGPDAIISDPTDPTTALVLGALAPNGGPTETIALLDGSLGAVDRTACTDVNASLVTVDQRNLDRPATACDVGAFEVVPLSLDIALDVDVTNYTLDPYDLQDPSIPGPEVGVGVVSVPVDNILPELLSRNEPNTGIGPEDTALNSVALNSVALNSVALNSVALNSVALNSVALALEAIALNSVALNSVALNSVALNSVKLSDIPLALPGGWDAFLEGTAFADFPIQSVTLGDLQGEGIDLQPISIGDIDLSATALNSVALHSVLLSDTALNSVALNSVDAASNELAWCLFLGAELCDVADDAQVAALGELTLLSLEFVEGVPPIPVFDIPISVALNSVALNSTALNSVAIENTALNSVALNSVALNSVGDSITVNCDVSTPNSVDCDTATLGDALAALAIDQSTTIGQVLAAIDPAVLVGFSLADLLLAFITVDEVPFESIDLDSALLQNVADPLQPEFHYIVTLDVTGGPAEIDVTLQLPVGFAFATNPLQGNPATFDGLAVSPTNNDLSSLEFTLSGVPAGSHQLTVAARAGLATGPFLAVAEAEATTDGESDSGGPATATVNVVEAFEDDGVGSTPPSLGIDGELQLAHVSRSDDVDLYKFTVPDAGFEGTSARILLSNIPAGVDYDLTVFAPPVQSLRGTPTTDLSSLGDVGFDLDPTDDVYATDVVQDIPLTTPQDWLGVDAAVRGVSSRRSSADEEVQTATLRAGETYYAQVTSYNADLSNQPYAIRLRLKETAPMPACAVGPRAFDHDMPAPTPVENVDIPTGVNTLFVTNAQWLVAALGADDGDEATNEADDVLAAVNTVATSGINGVVGALVPVDAYGPVRGAYNTWQNDRCNPDARNGVVTTIGRVLDDIIAANPGVENIVIVGDDGIVPMAGIPDLTTIANETSFAPEVVTLQDGTYSSNELSAALGAGLILTDDPYGTAAGILVGDHELYVPERNLGRLVETADQIVTSLDHFLDYNGELDPETFASALVSGYNFLSDGASEVRNALEADGLSVNSGVPAPGLIGDGWTKGDLLTALAAPGLDVISANAHYDYESLLPALQDAAQTWTPDELLFVSDLAALPSDPAADTINNLERAVVAVTMGCHAGLSVSDVQLSFTAADWAETYATGNNVLVAQTTYGYGDSDLVVLSERLTALFAGNISEMSVGEAVRFAKAEYLATTLVLNPYDEKILQSFTNYGLPMYEMGDGLAGAQPSAAETGTNGPAVLGSPGDGVTPITVDLTVDAGSSGPSNLHLVTVAGEGSYYEIDGNTLTAPYRPIQPLVDIALPAGSTARGFLITELSSQDETDFEPLYHRPSIDLSEREPRLSPGDGSFPASLQRVATYAAPDGQRQRLLLAAGQFQAGLENNGVPDQNVERLFTHIGGDLYSVGPDPADTAAPLFSRVIGRVSEQDAEDVVQFEIDVDDAARCYVLFKLPFIGQWQGLDLSQVGATTTWLGAAPVSDGTTLVEFFVQCVDANGNVAITDNKVDNFLAAEVIESGSLTVELSSPAGQQGDYFRGPVTATVTGLPSPLPEDYVIEYTIDSQLPFVAATVDPSGAVILPPVDGNGGHVILVQDSDGNREFRFFIIDDAAPELTATVSTDTSGTWATEVDVTLSAVDIGQSGVASIDYSTQTVAADGSITTTGPSSEPQSNVIVPITADGVTTVTATATDVAGNVSTEVSVVVRVDNAAPTANCPSPPDQWFASNQTLTCTVTDLGSGFSGSSTTTVELSTTVAAGEESANAAAGSPAGGPVTISDDAGQAVDVGPVPGFKIDRKGPVITVLGPDPAVAIPIGDIAVATYGCSDGGSGTSGGLAECAGEAAIDTSQPGPVEVTITATDFVGNQSTVTVTYRVAYGVCLEYDPFKEHSPGSVIPLKLFLCDSNGTNLSGPQLTLTAVGIDELGTAPPPNDAGKANSPFQFRYRNNGQSYIYNFDSDGIASGFHEFLFIVDGDPAIVYRAGFTIR